MRRSFVFALVLTTLVGAIGCGISGGGGGGGGDALFDVRMLLIPSPGETRAQALCEQGAEAAAEAQALVDALNAEVENDRALLEAIATADGRPAGAITRYEATVDGRTMVIEAITDGINDVLNGTIDGEEVLSATIADGGAAGALALRDVEVVWETRDGSLQAVRQTPTSEAVVHLEEDRVRIVQNDTIAGWTEEHGVIIVDDNPRCWQGDETCDVTCSADLVDEISADLE